MTQAFSGVDQEEMYRVLRNDMKHTSVSRSILSLYSARARKRTDYSPQYQRHYVWDETKATYFIESIMIGTETPPLVIYSSDGKSEVIDGRQRYETVKRFIDDELSLKSSGLSMLRESKDPVFARKKFTMLPTEWQNAVLETTLRVIEISTTTQTAPGVESRIKREIFSRYNSGLTPLSRVEIDKAKFFDRNLNIGIVNALKLDVKFRDRAAKLFLNRRDKRQRNPTNFIDLITAKIRILSVCHQASVYDWTQKRHETLNHLFERLDENSQTEEAVDAFIKTLKVRVKNLNIVSQKHEEWKFATARLVNDALFWAMSVYSQELCQEISRDNLEKLAISLASRMESDVSPFLDTYEISHPTTDRRYFMLKDILLHEFAVDASVYFGKLAGPHPADPTKIAPPAPEQSQLRLNRPAPSEQTIEEVMWRMASSKFLVRPPYQRQEVINPKKSSLIIESILLGFQLPTIFVFTRIDDIKEVVDGQQRLLTVLAYTGNTYRNEKNNEERSNKHGFKLTGLKVLSYLEGKSFQELSDEQQDRIMNFGFSIVTIEAKHNPDFNPVDLFVRLNSKPYPIRPDSFEMWNASVDSDVIQALRNIAKDCSAWFRPNPDNTRMEAEDLITALSCLEHTRNFTEEGALSKDLETYSKATGITLRLRNRRSLTSLLAKCEDIPEHKANVLECVKIVQRKIETVGKFLDGIATMMGRCNDTSFAFLPESRLRSIFKMTSAKATAKSSRVSLQTFYLLYELINSLEETLFDITDSRFNAVVEALSRIFSWIKIDASTRTVSVEEVVAGFNEEIQGFSAFCGEAIRQPLYEVKVSVRYAASRRDKHPKPGRPRKKRSDDSSSQNLQRPTFSEHAGTASF